MKCMHYIGSGLFILVATSVNAAEVTETPISNDTEVSRTTGDLTADDEDMAEQHALGEAYWHGNGVTQSYIDAVKSFRLAAKQGHAEAQNYLGYAYEKGTGVAQDYNESVKWYRLAADQGFAQAQNNLGKSYNSGNGVTRDYNESVRWFRLAADQGLASAQTKLGRAYEIGIGVTQDYGEAVRWFRLAADQGYADAQNRLGNAYTDGKGVAQDNDEAIKWYRLAADQGDIYAQGNLSYLLNTLRTSEQEENIGSGNPSIFGLELGVTSELEIEEKFNVISHDVSLHSNGKMYNLPIAEIGFSDLQEATAIFSEKGILMAVLTKFPKEKFDYLNSILVGKYSKISEDIPFVGNKSAVYRKGGTEIALEAPHLSFVMNMNYITDEFMGIYENNSRMEKQNQRQSDEDKL